MKLISDIKFVVRNEIAEEEKNFKKFTKIAGKPDPTYVGPFYSPYIQ